MTAARQNPSKQQRGKGLKANYGDATPEDVARALLLYRPERKQTAPKPKDKAKAPRPEV